MNIKVIIVPGNGGASPKDNWFPYLEQQLSKLGITVINRQFPDAMLARSEYWLPFIKQLGADEHTILIGHSSGAIAALRYAETKRILGSILVSAYMTDLGLASERISGYFSKSWDWAAIKANQQWIVQFASSDDPLIPIAQARNLHECLGSEYYEYNDQKHFGYGDFPKKEFPELVEVLKRKITIKE